jgi:hypothetical protein
VRAHIDTRPAKRDTLHLQTETLLERRFQHRFYQSAGTHDAMPWKRVAAFAENLSDLPMMQRIAGVVGHLTVGCDPSARNRRNHTSDG